MTTLLNAAANALGQVELTLVHNWPLLVLGILVSAATKVYLDQERLAGFLQRNQGRGVFAATAVAVTTPLCSCGTVAVILGMMASRMPWAPIVAFMVSSPLTSPEELAYSGAIFGWPFAWTYFAASVALGLLGGGAAYLLERAGWLAGQARVAAPVAPPERTPGPFRILDEQAAACCASVPAVRLSKGRQVLQEAWNTARWLLPRFVAFAFLGYLLNGLIPKGWVTGLFGQGQAFGVPLAATFGLPLYLNSESSLPLLKAFLSSGMSPGAALAFLITGAGTSLGAITGALTIARWRVVAVVVTTLWVGAILFGYGYNTALSLGLLH